MLHPRPQKSDHICPLVGGAKTTSQKWGPESGPEKHDATSEATQWGFTCGVVFFRANFRTEKSQQINGTPKIIKNNPKHGQIQGRVSGPPHDMGPQAEAIRAPSKRNSHGQTVDVHTSNITSVQSTTRNAVDSQTMWVCPHSNDYKHSTAQPSTKTSVEAQLNRGDKDDTVATQRSLVHPGRCENATCLR